MYQKKVANEIVSIVFPCISIYKRQLIYGKFKASIARILRLLYWQYGVEIYEVGSCPNHTYM